LKANRLVLLAVAGASMLSLSGCAQSGSSAAQIGNVTLSTSDVSFLTRMQCQALDRAAKDPAQAAQVQVLPTRLVQADMVNALVQAELNHQLALKLGTAYDRATYRSVMDQFEPVVLKAPFLSAP
jgi:ABC-type sugar transport system substrate-binding protein